MVKYLHKQTSYFQSAIVVLMGSLPGMCLNAAGTETDGISSIGITAWTLLEMKVPMGEAFLRTLLGSM